MRNHWSYWFGLMRCLASSVIKFHHRCHFLDTRSSIHCWDEISSRNLRRKSCLMEISMTLIQIVLFCCKYLLRLFPGMRCYFKKYLRNHSLDFITIFVRFLPSLGTRGFSNEDGLSDSRFICYLKGFLSPVSPLAGRFQLPTCQEMCHFAFK